MLLSKDFRNVGEEDFCRSPANLISNANAKGSEIKLYILAQSNNEKHIKGEKQLLDLTQSIKFMTKKFDDYEKDRAEKEKLIKDLREEVSSLKNEHEQLKSDVENQEQYSRRNCLLVHGIPEE